MQRAGVKPMRKDDTVAGFWYRASAGKIDRFVVAFNQTGIKFFGKAAVKTPINCS